MLKGVLTNIPFAPPLQQVGDLTTQLITAQAQLQDARAARAAGERAASAELSAAKAAAQEADAQNAARIEQLSADFDTSR